jgi:hypothetical protein
MKKINIILACGILMLISLDYLSLISEKYCTIACLYNIDGLGNNWLWLLITAIIFSISLSVYSQKLHQQWWKFARIAIPLILFLSWVISLGLHHTQGGFFNMDNAFDLLGLIILYAFFVIGSVVQIWRGYKN